MLRIINPIIEIGDILKKLFARIEKIPEKRLINYGIALGILISVIATLLLTHYFNNITIRNFGYSLLWLVLLIIVFVQHFSKVKPYSLSILLSVIVSVVTAILTIIYLTYVKNGKGASPPIAYFTQLFLARIIKEILQIEDKE